MNHKFLLKGPIQAEKSVEEESGTDSKEQPPSESDENIPAPEVKPRWKSPKTVTLREYPDHTTAGPGNKLPL